MGRRAIGLVGLWDCVAFDEVAGINLNRKVLAELAVNDAVAFAQLVEKAKSAL